MRIPKLCVLCCNNFHPEINAAVSAEGWDDVSVVAFPEHSACPDLGWKELRPLLTEDCTQVVILGGACLTELGEPPAGWPQVRVLRQTHCFQLIAASAIIEDALARGAYLMTPAWLQHWQDRIAAKGFKPENAGEFFLDSVRELLLLDTGIAPLASRHLAELSEATGLPASRMPVGLDHVQLFLNKIVLEWRLAQSRLSTKKMETQHARELADHALAIDCLSRLGQTMTEAEVVAAIEELFRMLFAPKEFYYLRMANGDWLGKDVLLSPEPLNHERDSPGNIIPPTLQRQMLELHGDYAWLPNHRGFLLKIGRNGQALGLLAIDHLTFPEYSERYLNLALAIAGVCGLAIENARAYQRTKEVERELQEKEERLSLATLINGVGIWDWNLQTQELICDDSMYALYRMLREDFSRTDEAWRAAVHPDDLPINDTAIAAAIAGIRPFDTEFRICWPSGEVRHIKAVAKVFWDDNGKPLRMLGINIDVTEQKQIEAALQKASRYARSLIEASLDPLVTISPDGKITDVNQATENVTGRSREDLIGSDFCHYFTEPNQARSGYKQAFELGSVTDYPLSIRHVSGKITDVLYNASVYRNERGDVEGVFAAARDVTERNRIASELENYRLHLEELVTERTFALSIAKDAAEAANRAKSVFLTNMSHELRTPMNAILGFTQLIARDKRLPADVLRNIATINKSGHHLLALINEILEISRIESGRCQVSHQPFDLIETLHAAGDMISVRAMAKGLAFTMECAYDLPHYVSGDAHRISQVLLNLLGNAVKFTEHGEVKLKVSKPAEGWVRFSVSDTGPGIVKEEQASIFDAFYQIESSLSKGEGTGLGLTISREFVRLMGGELSVISELNRGSTFSFSLPLATAGKPSETTKARIIGLKPGQPAPRILVAEDHPDNQQVIEQLLEQIGCEVIIAADGFQAVELFRSHQPNLILMDVRMPVMDGYRSTRRIRESPGGDTVPIIALTASVFEDDKAKVIEAGCNALLSKPVEAEPLFETIGKFLGLTFEYAAPDDALSLQEVEATNTEQSLSALPEDLRVALINAAGILDVENSLAIVEKMQAEYPDEAKLLATLIESYAFDKLISLCHKQ
ncbi:MAG: ATP-binding protein [Methylomonas sp.]|nr:ATP-binding protein [Methylomonas sp.]